MGGFSERETRVRGGIWLRWERDEGERDALVRCKRMLGIMGGLHGRSTLESIFSYL